MTAAEYADLAERLEKMRLQLADNAARLDAVADRSDRQHQRLDRLAAWLDQIGGTMNDTEPVQVGGITISTDGRSVILEGGGARRSLAPAEARGFAGEPDTLRACLRLLLLPGRVDPTPVEARQVGLAMSWMADAADTWGWGDDE